MLATSMDRLPTHAALRYASAHQPDADTTKESTALTDKLGGSGRIFHFGAMLQGNAAFLDEAPACDETA